MNTATGNPLPHSDGATAADVYLQPHSDDICFSLGCLAQRRGRGLLLTGFPVSIHVAGRWRAQLSSQDAVTRERLSEDAAFAQACGFALGYLKAADALTMERDIWDLSWAGENADRMQAPLLQALLPRDAGRGTEERPWLFAPAGIGGHVDHVAVLMLVARHWDGLSASYRIGLYEDLPYASDMGKREKGLKRLFELLPGRRLNRHAWPLGEAADAKLSLIRGYKSQFDRRPRSLARFTPAAETPPGPHEAVWSQEAEGPA